MEPVRQEAITQKRLLWYKTGAGQSSTLMHTKQKKQRTLSSFLLLVTTFWSCSVFVVKLILLISFLLSHFKQTSDASCQYEVFYGIRAPICMSQLLPAAPLNSCDDMATRQPTTWHSGGTMAPNHGVVMHNRKRRAEEWLGKKNWISEGVDENK